MAVDNKEDVHETVSVEPQEPIVEHFEDILKKQEAETPKIIEGVKEIGETDISTVEKDTGLLPVDIREMRKSVIETTEAAEDVKEEYEKQLKDIPNANDLVGNYETVKDKCNKLNNESEDGKGLTFNEDNGSKIPENIGMVDGVDKLVVEDSSEINKKENKLQERINALKGIPNWQDKQEELSNKCPKCGRKLVGPFCGICGSNSTEALLKFEEEKKFSKKVKDVLSFEEKILLSRAETFGISDERVRELLKEVEKYLIEKNKVNIDVYLDRRNNKEPEAKTTMGSYGVLSRKIKIEPSDHETSAELAETLSHEFTHLCLNETLFSEFNKKWLKEESGRYKTKAELDNEYSNFIFSVNSKLDHPAFYRGNMLLKNDAEADSESVNANVPEDVKEFYLLKDEEVRNAIKEEIEDSLTRATEDIQKSREGQHKFFSLYQAFDESAAFAGVKYVADKKSFPNYNSYKNKTELPIFKIFFKEMEKFSDKLSLKQFDLLTKIGAEIIADNWTEDSTSEDYMRTGVEILAFFNNINDKYCEKNDEVKKDNA